MPTVLIGPTQQPSFKKSTESSQAARQVTLLSPSCHVDTGGAASMRNTPSQALSGTGCLLQQHEFGAHQC